MFIRTPPRVYSSPFDFCILQLHWARRAETSARNLLTARVFQVSLPTSRIARVMYKFNGSKAIYVLTSFSLRVLRVSNEIAAVRNNFSRSRSIMKQVISTEILHRK